MVLRAGAGQRPGRWGRASTREPGGSGVWTYVWMPASSTWRSRGVSSSGVVISSNMLTTSAMRQGSGERIEPQPAERGAPESAVVAHGHPPCDFPWRYHVTLAGEQCETSIAPQREIHQFGRSVGLGGGLLALERIGAGHNHIPPGGIRPRVPTPNLTVEPVGPRPQADVGDARPVRRVVA